MKKVSIIITNYNNDKYLGRAIRSCINQNFPTSEIEVIVVDDGSTDNSRKVIENFEEKIIHIYLKKNQGVSYASNEGIKKARGNK